MKKRALLIGVNKYHLLGELKWARQDAEAVADALRKYWGFTDQDVTLMTCQSERAGLGLSRYVEYALTNLIEERDVELLVFGFWGHGYAPVPGRRYLCGMDTDEKHLEQTAVSFDVVKAKLAQVGALNTVLLLDCCQNRPTGRAVSAEPMTEGEEIALASMARDIQAANREQGETTVPTVAILNACREGQKAYEWDSRGHGIFTAHLLDAFEQGFASVAPMAAWLFDRVAKTSRELHQQVQTPYVTIKGKGDIILLGSIPSKDISEGLKPEIVDKSVSVPSVPRPVIDPKTQQKASYREALVAAAEDGEITREKWQDLLTLRNELGLCQALYEEIEKDLWSGTSLDEICHDYRNMSKPKPVLKPKTSKVKVPLVADSTHKCNK